MRLLKGLVIGVLWLLVLVSVGAGAVNLVGYLELEERLAGQFLMVQPWFPMLLNFHQFLLALTVTSLLLSLLVFGIAVLMVSWVVANQLRKSVQTTAAKRETDQVKADHQQQLQQLLSLEQTLSTQLDKRVLVQNVVEAASRMCSVPQANSVVGLWMLHFETGTFRFEQGLYCDETLFTKTMWKPNEAPIARVYATHKPWVSSKEHEGMECVRPDRIARLGGTTRLILVPLVIENSVLGVLALFCHPDFVKAYEERRGYYDMIWSAMTLAIASAVQGEVAILDRLTGTQNREYFMKRFVQEIERANRYQLPLSLLMVDIDNFKRVNDMLGHPQGDAVLRIISRLIKHAVRAIDLVGRYGGEEFIILLPETGYGEKDGETGGGAITVAERIRKAVDDEFRGLQKPLDLSVSVGVMCRRFPEDRQQDYRDVVRIADEQLYKAKTSGKNKVCVFEQEKSQGVT